MKLMILGAGLLGLGVFLGVTMTNATFSSILNTSADEVLSSEKK